MILLVTASQVAIIIDVSHQHLTAFVPFTLKINPQARSGGTCNPSCLEGRDRRITVLDQPGQKVGKILS
jgi:hypothetical protein